jgi:uncharacterized RDD family membrane protein YckC
VRPAGTAPRAAAVIVDALLTLIVLGTIVSLVFGQAHRAHGFVGFNLHGWAAFVWIALAFAYWIVCEHVWGMTIGKRLFSIHVEGPTGGKPTWAQSVVRNLFRLVDAFPFLIPYLLGFVITRTNEERQRIGDIVVGTRVVTSP